MIETLWFVHRIRYTAAAWRNGVGLCWERAYRTTGEGLCEARLEILAYLQGTLKVRAPSESALTYCVESTAAYHYPVMLCFAGYPCVVNPLLAHAGRRKTDRLDARALAHQAITGTWKPSYTADAELEAIRLILNHRRRLVKERTKLTNSMKTGRSTPTTGGRKATSTSASTSK